MVNCNVVSPGWVANKKGGPYAPDDLEKAPETQVWLASSDEQSAKITGQFFYHKKPKHYLSKADDVGIQERFIRFCESLTNIEFPHH